MMLLEFETWTIMGELTSKFNYPVFEVIRYVSIAEFLERLDPVVISGWIYWVFLKETVLLFVFCLCLSKLFGLSNYRVLVIPVTLLAIIGSQWVFKKPMEIKAFVGYTLPFYYFVMQNLIPTVFLVADTVRKRRGKEHEG